MKITLLLLFLTMLAGWHGCPETVTGDDTGVAADAGFTDAAPDSGGPDSGGPDSGDADSSSDAAVDTLGGDGAPDAPVADGTGADGTMDGDVSHLDGGGDAASVEDADDAGPGDAGPGDAGPGDAGPGDADAGPGDADAGPGDADVLADPPFGAQVPVSGGTDYDSGELHGMTAAAGQVSVFWRGAKTDGSVDLLLSVSDPSTTAFAAPVVLKAGLPPQGITAGGDLAQAGPTYFFIWRDEDTGSEQVYFRKTSQADLAGSDVLLAEAPANVWRPYLARGLQGSMCALWQHAQDVRMRCSDDDGDSWASAVPVDPAGTTATVSAAAFTDANDLVVALQAGGLNANQIHVRRTSDLGLSWEDATTVGGTSLTNGAVSEVLGQTNYLKPTLVLTLTGMLKLAWHRPLQGTDAEAHMVTSSDGLSWTAPTVLPSVKANVALVPGRSGVLHASGTEAKLGYGDTVYMSSPDEGTSWGSAAPIPTTPDATLLDHRMRAHIVEGWLYIAWWETLPNNLLKQQLQLVTIENP